MSGGAKMALAVAAGYYFGRHHKLLLSTALAVAGVISRMKAGKGGMLEQGMKALGSPELEEAADRLRGDLMEVGKAAAVATTNKQINALTDIIHGRAEALRHPDGHDGAQQPKGTEAPEKAEAAEKTEKPESGEAAEKTEKGEKTEKSEKAKAAQPGD